MDRQLAERMVGAAVLLVALVVVVPAVLDGRGDVAADGTEPSTAPIDLRTHTIQVDQVTPRPPVPRPADTPDPEVPALAAEEDTTGPLADVAPAPAGGEPAVAVVEPAAELPAPAAPAPEPVPGPEPAATPAARTVPAPPVAAASPAPAGEWLVQLGSFAQRDNASRLAAAVRARGFAADVSETGGGGGRLYRVRVGPATTREAADARARDLSAAGYRGSVTRR
jgi:DedD protein